MSFVLVLCGGFWLAAWGLKVPIRLRLAGVAFVILGVIGLHLILPEGHHLRQATGGRAQPWIALLGLGGVVWAYRAGVLWLRAKAPGHEDAGGAPSDTELRRYDRHIMLREIGGPGQMALRDAKVLVVGAGGLGAPSLLYLAGGGVGVIGIIDPDEVEGSNLQRQIIHRDQDIGVPKVFSAERAIRDLNPFVTVRPYARTLDAENAPELFAQYDLILDGTDLFETRSMINAAAVATGTPLISGAISQWEGQITLFDPARGGPCMACVFPKPPAPGQAPSCAEAGVAGPLPGVIGSMMALEAVKHITDAGEGLRGQMVVFDGLYGQSRHIALAPRDDCPVCAEKRREGVAEGVQRA